MPPTKASRLTLHPDAPAIRHRHAAHFSLPWGDARVNALAWLHDSRDNEVADYPGPGWDGQVGNPVVAEAVVDAEPFPYPGRDS